MTHIAVVLTCHNRKDLTVSCIESIKNSLDALDERIDISFFICDDGSTDGTSDSLKTFSDLSISIINGDGSLFWAKGMAKALAEAEKFSPDFFLLVNDDVSFFPNMLSVMLDSFYKNHNSMCAIVGCTLNKEKTTCSYGGFCWDSRSIVFKKGYRRVLPSDKNKECKWANWNCFLLPRGLYERIGKIDDYYEHSFADYDYSNRIVNSGCHMFVAHDYIGTCDRNPVQGTYLDKSLSLFQRLSLIHKKTARPFRSSWHYAKKFYGIFSVFVFLSPYLYVVITSFYKRKH